MNWVILGQGSANYLSKAYGCLTHDLIIAKHKASGLFNIFMNDLIMFWKKLAFAILWMIIAFTNIVQTCR